MKNILVPCDFSQQSQAAYKTAIEIASHTGGKIVLFHVLYLPNLYTTGLGGETLSFDPVYLTSMEEDAKAELERLKAEATAFGVDVKIEVTLGEIVTSIKRIIENDQIDLVIMGTTGASGLSEILIGSNTEKVVRNVPVPVLAIRKDTLISSIRNILLPSTLEPDQTEFIRNVKELQEFFDATLHVLLINTPAHFLRDSDAKALFSEFAEHHHLKNYKTHFRNYQSEEEGIIDFALNEKMDMIAMATHSRRGLAHLFSGSTTEDVVNHIEVPVWTFSLRNKAAKKTAERVLEDVVHR